MGAPAFSHTKTVPSVHVKMLRIRLHDPGRRLRYEIRNRLPAMYLAELGARGRNLRPLCPVVSSGFMPPPVSRETRHSLQALLLVAGRYCRRFSRGNRRRCRTLPIRTTSAGSRSPSSSSSTGTSIRRESRSVDEQPAEVALATPQFLLDRELFAMDLLRTGKVTQKRARSLADVAVREAYTRKVPPGARARRDAHRERRAQVGGAIERRRRWSDAGASASLARTRPQVRHERPHRFDQPQVRHLHPRLGGREGRCDRR